MGPLCGISVPTYTVAGFGIDNPEHEAML